MAAELGTVGGGNHYSIFRRERYRIGWAHRLVGFDSHCDAFLSCRWQDGWMCRPPRRGALGIGQISLPACKPGRALRLRRPRRRRTAFVSLNFACGDRQGVHNLTTSWEKHGGENSGWPMARRPPFPHRDLSAGAWCDAVIIGASMRRRARPRFSLSTARAHPSRTSPSSLRVGKNASGARPR